MKTRTKSMAFGKALRGLRIEQGLSQETLAFESNLDRTYISLLELGTHSPTLETMITLCSAMGISFVDLAQKIEPFLNEEFDE